MPVSDRNSRHALIKDIIFKGKVATQSELVSLLRKRGKRVTQATVSRDLNDLGVYTDRGENSKNYYVLPSTPQIANKQQLQKVLGEWSEKILISGNIVIIKTLPGSAHVVASALDRSEQSEILATIAGDDTVFIVVKESSKNPKAQALGRELKEMTGRDF